MFNDRVNQTHSQLEKKNRLRKRMRKEGYHCFVSQRPQSYLQPLSGQKVLSRYFFGNKYFTFFLLSRPLRKSLSHAFAFRKCFRSIKMTSLANFEKLFLSPSVCARECVFVFVVFSESHLSDATSKGWFIEHKTLS
jgi:hypothetical protein